MRNGVIGMSDMSGIGEVLNGVIKKAVENNPVEDGDYLDSEGFIVCGKCHTRRQVEIEVPDLKSDEPGKKVRIRSQFPAGAGRRNSERKRHFARRKKRCRLLRP